MYIPILSEIIGGVRDHFKGKQEIKKAQVEGQIAVTHKAADNIATWEQLHAKGSQDSWKDEYWTIILSVPVIGGFAGYSEEVKAGFKALEAMPEWYQYVLISAILASFGIRMTGKIKALKDVYTK